MTSSRRSALFIGLTLAVSWTAALISYLAGVRWNTPAAQAFAVGYMFVPAIVAVVLQRMVFREAVKGPLGVSFRLNRWFVVAWLLPPVLAFAALGVSLLLPGVEYSPEMEGLFGRLRAVLPPDQMDRFRSQVRAARVHPVWLALLQGLGAGPTVNAVAGFGEELGWRGLLQRGLAYLGFWKMSAVVGLVWGIWHAPLILQGHNYPQHPVAGVFMMTAFTLLLAPIFAYVRLRSGSVIAAAILHGSLNGTSGLALMLIRGGSDLTVGVTGLAGLIVLCAANLILLRYGGVRPGKPR